MFWKKFIALCNEKGISPTTVVTSLNISRGSVTGWKKGTTPNDTTLQKIADYFGVTPEYLLSDYDAEREKVAEEVATMMDDLTEDERQDVIKYIDFLKAKRGGSK